VAGLAQRLQRSGNKSFPIATMWCGMMDHSSGDDIASR
jgi:hypothetical protein